MERSKWLEVIFEVKFGVSGRPNGEGYEDEGAFLWLVFLPEEKTNAI